MTRTRSHRPCPPGRITRLAATIRAAAVILAVVAATLSLTAASVSAAPSPTPAPVSSLGPDRGPGLGPSPSPQVSWIAPPPPASSDGCGWLDVGCKINHAVNGWFTTLVVEAINPAFAMVGRTLLSSPPPSMLARVRELTGHVQLVANALLGLFVLAGGIIVMAYGSVQTATTVKEIAPRLVVATIALNVSLTLCEYAVQLANALVSALLGEGVDGARAGNLLAGKVAAIVGDPTSTLLFLVLMVGAAVLMGIILAFIAVIRVALLLFLIIAAPLALLCHALPQTEGIARLWWRAITGVLAMQVLQALALILAFKVYLTNAPDVFAAPRLSNTALAAAQPTASRAVDALVLIGLLYLLIKIPGWTARTIWQQTQPTLLKRLIKAMIVYKTLGAVSSALGKTRATRAAKTTTAHRHGRPPNRGGGRTGAAGRGPRPKGGPSPHGGRPSVTSSTSAGLNPGSGSGAARSRRPQQLALPFGIPPATRTPARSSASGSGAARRGRQLALPFPVTRVPRPPAPAPPANGPWIRPRPPYVQDRLPGMPTRAPRPGQLRLRLDPPPRRKPRKEGQ